MRERLPALGRVVVMVGLVAAVSAPAAAHAAGTSSLSGAVYDDANRNGLQDAGEAPFSGQLLLLFDSAGTNIASTQTDANGRYAFTGLADGTYTVKFATQYWWDLRASWVPTTTGSLYFARTVALSGSASADFGLRQIVRSTDIAAPVSSYRASSGLVVNSYDDAVPASAVAAALAQGTLLGPEAATTTVYFDYGSQTDATTSVAGQPGSYSSFSASLWIAYLSWLDTFDAVLFHEYGHAWSTYNADIVQQDDTLAAYLDARGITGDPRLYSSKAWDPHEMIAEDYRQLFGSATAAAYPQANTDVPPAAQVAGLKDFLQTTFTQPPASGTSSTPPPPPPPPAVVISSLAVTPQPVTKSGTVSFDLSQHATVTVAILDSSGSVVRSLLTGASASGPVSVRWDRRDGAGRRVRSGTYTAAVTATDDYGNVATASLPFQVG